MWRWSGRFRHSLQVPAMKNDPIYKHAKQKTGNINKSYLENNPVSVARIDRIVAEAKGKVLDLGCNGGIVSILIARKGSFAIGIDFLDTQIDVANAIKKQEKQEVRDRLQFIVSNAEETEFPENCFDTVVIGQLLEHVTFPRRVLIEAKRVLKQNGKVLISTPIGYNRSRNHIRWFTKNLFVSLVSDYFRVDDFVNFDNIQMLIIGTNK